MVDVNNSLAMNYDGSIKRFLSFGDKKNDIKSTVNSLFEQKTEDSYGRTDYSTRANLSTDEYFTKMKQTAKNVSYDVSDEDLMKAVKSYDRNGDGKIDINESKVHLAYADYDSKGQLFDSKIDRDKIFKAASSEELDQATKSYENWTETKVASTEIKTDATIPDAEAAKKAEEAAAKEKAEAAAKEAAAKEAAAKEAVAKAEAEKKAAEEAAKKPGEPPTIPEPPKVEDKKPEAPKAPEAPKVVVSDADKKLAEKTNKENAQKVADEVKSKTEEWAQSQKGEIKPEEIAAKRAEIKKQIEEDAKKPADKSDDKSSQTEKGEKKPKVSTKSFKEFEEAKMKYYKNSNESETFEFIKAEDGEVSRGQYKKSVRELAKSMYSDLGGTSDTKVSKEKFVDLIKNEQIARDESADDAAETGKQMFKTFDLNNDGKLSQNELEAYVVDRDSDDNGNIDGEFDFETTKSYGTTQDRTRVASQYQSIMGKNIYKPSKEDTSVSNRWRSGSTYSSNPASGNANQSGLSPFVQQLISQNQQGYSLGGYNQNQVVNLGSMMTPDPLSLFSAMGGTSNAQGGTLGGFFPMINMGMGMIGGGFGSPFMNSGFPMMNMGSMGGSNFNSFSGSGYVSNGGGIGGFPFCSPFGNGGYSTGSNTNYTGTSDGLTAIAMGSDLMKYALGSFMARG